MPDTRYANTVLTSNEQVINQFGYHWLRYIKLKYFAANLLPAVIVAGATIGVISLSIGTLAWEWIATVGLFLWMFIAWLVWTIITSDVRIITNKRVILKEGFFSRKTQEIKLSAIEAIEFDQKWWERLLRVGCLEITGRGGGTEIHFHHVARPIEVKHMIENINWRETGDGAYDPELDG